MLSARLFRKPVARLLVFSIIVISMIGVGIPFAPGSRTRACPAPPPQPLRQLYVQSAHVVVASVGKSEVTKTEGEGEGEGEDEDKMTYLKTALLVSSTLKGEPEPVVYVHHWMYREYKDTISSATEGEQLLVFLSQNKEDGNYYVDDMSYGIKKLSDAHLKVYVQRIEELASIMKAEKPSDTEIVEWLVRCAEDPVTQWEGAYELAMSHYAIEVQTEQAAREATSAVEASDTEAAEDAQDVTTSEEAQAAEAGDVEINSDEVPSQEITFIGDYAMNAKWARLLTTEQKYRLTTTLTSIETLDSTHHYLIELAQKWDDARLVPYLLTQLRKGRDDEGNYFTDQLMMIVAKKLGDEALVALAEKISNGEEVGDVDYAEETDEANNEAVVEKTAEQEEAEQAAILQKRKTMVQYFVTLAESTVPKAAPEQAVTAKASATP
ncbi:MAG: hypothetical protein H7Y30_03440 [Pyrinomonadaceae bacterium]|nr:hypothetical protein [Pyrinomonadaceae bacterium]